MAWRERQLGEGEVLEFCFEGYLTRAELFGASRRAVEWSRVAKRWRWLADCTRLTGGHDAFDLYELIQWLESHGLPPEFREAVLVGPQGFSRENGEFWETACRNRGLRVRWFTDRDEAIAWLGESGAAVAMAASRRTL